MKRHTAALTLVELLLAMSILAVLLSVIATFFQSQTQMAQLTHARASAQDTARFVMTAASQDLQLAGSSRYISGAPTTVSTVAAFGTCVATVCLTGTDSGVRDNMAMRYITSLRPLSESCRNVAWTVAAGGILNRSDVACGAAANPQAFASGILAFNIRYICSDSTVVETPSCTGAKFTRSARVTVYAQADQVVRTTTAASFDVEGTTVSCPSQRMCFGIQQEIEMPNMKDK